jgi:hypothetical protein
VDSRLHDILMLVSRVQEKRGDIRFMVRQEPAVQREVHAYLDDLQWLAQVRTPEPSSLRTAGNKEALMAELQHSRRRRFVPARVFGVAAGFGLFLAICVMNQGLAPTLAQPVDETIGDLFVHEEQVQASPVGSDLSTPAEASLSPASPGFTN